MIKGEELKTNLKEMRSEQEDSGSGGEGGEEDEIGHLDLSYAKLIVYWLDANNRSGVVDFTKPHVKLSLRYVYPLFILLYAIVMVTGTIGNAGMLVVIGRRRRLYKDPTQVYLANLAFSDLVKAAIVLPLTLVGQLLQNWILGGFLCYFLPMMQVSDKRQCLIFILITKFKSTCLLNAISALGFIVKR